MINEQSPSQTSDSEPTKCIIVHILIIILHPHLHLPSLGIKSPKLKQNSSPPILPYSSTDGPPATQPAMLVLAGNKKLISLCNLAMDDDPGETHKLVSIWQLLFKSILLKLFLLKNETYKLNWAKSKNSATQFCPPPRPCPCSSLFTMRVCVNPFPGESHGKLTVVPPIPIQPPPSLDMSALQNFVALPGGGASSPAPASNHSIRASNRTKTIPPSIVSPPHPRSIHKT